MSSRTLERWVSRHAVVLHCRSSSPIALPLRTSTRSNPTTDRTSITSYHHRRVRGGTSLAQLVQTCNPTTDPTSHQTGSSNLWWTQHKLLTSLWEHSPDTSENKNKILMQVSFYQHDVLKYWCSMFNNFLFSLYHTRSGINSRVWIHYVIPPRKR
jgi:hypothetical protein